ncbi:acetyl-CoA carboxylase biotin carboxylase subunit [Pararhizobium haloflavum]|uniref:acetyl-CoA carboxylase biotin carboxylase subunit n=1 Tax=Pararhizobium haloflavum TaxID=2037914 RepID=UPI000C177732|nr:biotin carboxylase N-terminal domain-containing protein [Pararhizobium haloflavum]
MRRILIANRGEISRRITRSAHELGIETVAVYSEADREAAHVVDADHAVDVGPAPARQSYLDTDRILEAASRASADAVHPGYGFLSENADFAEAVLRQGLCWIGPAPHTLRAMGDKQRAREIAVAANVPVVPGSGRIAEGELSRAEAEAEAVGFPLLVKASAGGGGIGMRRVDSIEKLVESVKATQSMAAKSFGDGTVFLERYVPRARHVEIQVFGFGDGTAVHLFERDCSLQRRFQKIIEEAPAPGLSRARRAAMAEAAISLCRATRYAGAGTVEFILDVESEDFFFLEMNTRIQVEHPVTEMITGRDLVAMQIDFARGRLAAMEQHGISAEGHALECRLYAENPAKMFMPSPGRLERFALPADSATVRVDTGYRAGDMVTPYYDPLLAKIVVKGADRELACATAIEALGKVDVEGVATNRDFLIACLRDDAFRKGAVHTAFIDMNHQQLLAA